MIHVTMPASTPQFSWAIALSAARFAKIAYEDTPNGFTKIESGNARAQIANYDGIQFVAIAGSNDRDDWRQNLRASVIIGPWVGGAFSVHTGFLEHHNAIWPGIRESLDMSRPIVVTGHSLGGAVAQMVALSLADGGKRALVISFGAPRVFQRGYGPTGMPIHRVEIASDGVPLVPSKTRFAKVGMQHIIAADGKVSAERDSVLLRLLQWWRDGVIVRLFKSVKSHSVAEYESRVLKAWERTK